MLVVIIGTGGIPLGNRIVVSVIYYNWLLHSGLMNEWSMHGSSSNLTICSFWFENFIQVRTQDAVATFTLLEIKLWQIPDLAQWRSNNSLGQGSEPPAHSERFYSSQA